MPLTRAGLLILFVCAALVGGGCGGGSSSTSSSRAETSKPQEAGETSAAAHEDQAEGKAKSEEAAPKTKPKVTVPSGPAPGRLVVKEIEEGSGPEAKPGDEVAVQYVGVNYKTHEEFGASWDRGEPLVFKLGEGLVIDGWEKGIAGMKPGGRRELIIPPDLGYGNHRTETIPPESTLVFVVDLISVK